MSRILLNKDGTMDTVTLILQTKAFETLNTIRGAKELTYKENYNAANETSFTIDKFIDGNKNLSWYIVTNFKVLYIPELKERFEIYVSKTEENSIVKEVTGTSLCEAELSNTNLYNIEVNTEDDIISDDYDENFPTIFYRELDVNLYNWNDTKYNGKYLNYTDTQKINVLKRGSLLHRLLDKAPNYSIKYVQDSLKKLSDIKTFTIDDKSIYDELTGEISEEYGVIFKFNSMTREISVYDLYNTCENCGYRGDFNNKCPECGGTKFNGQDGKDTTIFISSHNLAQDIKLECDTSSIKNCFCIKGGDDNITEAVKNINSNGSNYIYRFTDDTYNDMPAELVTKLKAYNSEFENYQKYGGDLSDLSLEIASLDGKLKDFSSAYAEVKKNLGEAPITPEIISNIEHYVELLDKVRYLKSWHKSDDKDIIAQDESSAKYFLDSAIYKAQEQNYNYTDSLKTQEIQAIATAEAEKKLAETQKEVSFTSSETNISLENSPKKDAFPKTDSSATNASTSAIKEENNALEQTTQSAEKAANSKKKFANANKEVKDSANASVGAIKDENNAFDKNEWDKNVKAIQKYMDAVNGYKEHTLNWFKSTWNVMNFASSVLPSTSV